MLDKKNNPAGADEARAKAMASNMVTEMLADMILESEAPDQVKLGVRLVMQGKRVSSAVHNLVDKLAGNLSALKESDIAVLASALEYLTLVETGLNQFMKQNNVPNED